MANIYHTAAKSFFSYTIKRSFYLPWRVNTEYFLILGAALLLAEYTVQTALNSRSLLWLQDREVEMLNYLQIQLIEFLILVCLDTS